MSFDSVLRTRLQLLTAALVFMVDAFIAFDNNFTGPFTCPDYIEICTVSCNNVTNEQCRDLDGAQVALPARQGG